MSSTTKQLLRKKLRDMATRHSRDEHTLVITKEQMESLPIEDWVVMDAEAKTMASRLKNINDCGNSLSN
jgi:hypothetical protein